MLLLLLCGSCFQLTDKHLNTGLDFGPIVLQTFARRQIDVTVRSLPGQVVVILRVYDATVTASHH